MSMIETQQEAPEKLVGKLFRFHPAVDAYDEYEFYSTKPTERLPYTWEDSFNCIKPYVFVIVGFEYTDFKEEANCLLFHVLLTDGRKGWMTDFWQSSWIELKEESE